MNFGEKEIEFEIKRRYNIDKETLKRRGRDRKYIYRALSEIYPSELLENDEDFNPRMTKRVPKCIDTKNSICMPGTFARYNIGNYDELNNFEDIYHLLFQTIIRPLEISNDSPKTPEEPPPPERIPDIIVLGIFLIFVEYGRDEGGQDIITISFARTDWEDERDRDGSKILDTPKFEQLMETSPVFKKYIDSCITKIVQDRFVFDRSIRTSDNQEFHIFLDFYYNRSLKQSDVFHQDHENLIGVDYFTLTYILPEDKVVLGASLLVEHGGELDRQLNPGEYASVSVAVKNLTTVGLTNNKTYHATPAPISCRTFKSKQGNFRIPSEYKQNRKGILEVTEQNPDTFIHDDTKEFEIDLVPLNLEPLPEDEMEDVKEVIDNTMTTRRSFIRCWYATMHGNSTFSIFYTIDINKEVVDRLRDEALDIEIITLSTLFQHVLGGKVLSRKVLGGKPRRRKGTIHQKGEAIQRKGKITKLRKLFYNPNKNIILKT